MREHLQSASFDYPVSGWGYCDNSKNRDAGTGCIDAPGFGSGLTWNPCGEQLFTITDRGPVQVCLCARVRVLY